MSLITTAIGLGTPLAKDNDCRDDHRYRGVFGGIEAIKAQKNDEGLLS